MVVDVEASNATFLSWQIRVFFLRESIPWGEFIHRNGTLLRREEAVYRLMITDENRAWAIDQQRRRQYMDQFRGGL